MTKTHLTDRGPMPCKAKTPASCRAKYAGESSPHFDDAVAAQREFENDLKAKHGTVPPAKTKTTAKTKTAAKKGAGKYMSVAEREASKTREQALRSEDPQVLDSLSTHESAGVRAEVATRGNLRDSTMIRLAADENATVAGNLAIYNDDRRLPAEAVENLLTHKTPVVRQHTLSRRNIEKEASTEQLFRAASDRDATSSQLDLLSRMSGENSDGIRVAVARNPNTAESTLAEMFNRRERTQHNLELAIAAHPNTPPFVLDECKYSTDDGVLKAVIRNPNVPKHILDRMRNNTLLPAYIRNMADRVHPNSR